MLLPLVQIHRDVREHINGSLKHIKAFVCAGVMKTVTWVVGFDVQAKWLAKAVRAAQMRATRTAALVSSDEHGIMMRHVLVTHLFRAKYETTSPPDPRVLRRYANTRCTFTFGTCGTNGFCSAALIRDMVEPLTAAYRDAVVACQPLFTSGFDEPFTLADEKFFGVDGRDAFLLFWCKFDKFADFSYHFLLLQRVLFWVILWIDSTKAGCRYVYEKRSV